MFSARSDGSLAFMNPDLPAWKPLGRYLADAVPATSEGQGGAAGSLMLHALGLPAAILRADGTVAEANDAFAMLADPTPPVRFWPDQVRPDERRHVTQGLRQAAEGHAVTLDVRLGGPVTRTVRAHLGPLPAARRLLLLLVDLTTEREALARPAPSQPLVADALRATVRDLGHLAQTLTEALERITHGGPHLARSADGQALVPHLHAMQDQCERMLAHVLKLWALLMPGEADASASLGGGQPGAAQRIPPPRRTVTTAA